MADLDLAREWRKLADHLAGAARSLEEHSRALRRRSLDATRRAHELEADAITVEEVTA